MPFVQNIQPLTLKSTEELYFMTLKSHAKFEEKLTWGLDNDMRNLAHFHQNHLKKSKLVFSWDTFVQSRKCMSYKVVVISNDTEEWWKVWRGIDLSFQNWHKEFDEFWLENSKVSKIYTLLGCFWPKDILFELKKHRGAIFRDTQDW